MFLFISIPFIYYCRSTLVKLAPAFLLGILLDCKVIICFNVDKQQFLKESILRNLLTQSQVHKNTLWSSINPCLHPHVWILEAAEAIHTRMELITLPGGQCAATVHYLLNSVCIRVTANVTLSVSCLVIML